MIKALAIDDEPLALRQLEMYISKVPFLELIAACKSAAEAKPYVDVADVMFVDINMPDLSGMDFVKALPDPPMTVFTTAYSEYALEGFKVEAVDYLLKPFSLEDFCRSCERVKERHEQRNAAKILSESGEALFFKADYKDVRVELSRILWIESMSEYIKIHLDGEPAPLMVLYSLKKLMEELPASRFVRIHRSYIVSIPGIAKASGSIVEMSDGKQLPVGDIFRKQFREAYKAGSPAR